MEEIGQSNAFLDLQERISRAAKTDRPLILIGERGTGKELAAARLHSLSGRWKSAYVCLNCASLTPTLIESELFGHEAGAFTGAIRRRKGRFELADGGSLFLDEVANIPLTAQEKILRVVEYGKLERVGGSETLHCDARLIAATNVDLREMARDGRFREDLLDRLSFEVITLPPLRARREDIPLLAQHFARKMASEMNLGYLPKFSDAATRALLEYAWPGNIRELKNVVERMVYRTEGNIITEIVFDPFESEFSIVAKREKAPPRPDWNDGKRLEVPTQDGSSIPQELESMPLEDAVRELELRRIKAAMQECRHNHRKTAERLGISYNQFRTYLRKHRVELGGSEIETQRHELTNNS